ncbi:MAG: gamma-glutamyl-gamma-aminobutyrate hydrolase family protein [Phycisphaerales bacterium]|nr:gamma-glutamyl-gamma-aminobutyrate hydrolase family protein [Phycisphaerales bacterium]
MPPRPLIGITSDLFERSEGKWSAAVALPYCENIAKAGGIPLILPPIPDSVADHAIACDAFIFTGGNDPDTRQWGIPMHPLAKPLHPQRQAYETRLLELLRTQHGQVPVLGICLGMQMMCLDAGGKLDQHLGDSLPTADTHRNSHHAIMPILSLDQGCPAWLASGGLAASNHHQGIADPGRTMTVLAKSDDGIIEAVVDRSRPYYYGVQWHPERTADSRLGLDVFRSLIGAARPR